ncbi:MAG: AraC family transcriptional regulator [Oscillospiraceae bacterium]|jgi:AraC-like DNA-binding protein|nr:AraC family transcriptional regulator [Oscillospiraceae bacterium]
MRSNISVVKCAAERPAAGQGLDSIYAVVEYFIHRACTPKWRIISDEHTHFIDLTYVVGGCASYRINGETYTVRKGDLLCVPQGSERTATCKPCCPMECYTMNFQLYDFYTRQNAVLPFNLLTRIGTQPNVVRLMDELYRVWISREEGYVLRANAYALLIISELLSVTRNEARLSSVDLRVRKAADYIMQHYGEQLTTSMLADLVHLNPVYLSSLFRKSLGTSVRQYIQRIRISNAELLLEEGVYNITQVAEMCGFRDVYYFSRTFKQMKGVPPSALIHKEPRAVPS